MKAKDIVTTLQHLCNYFFNLFVTSSTCNSVKEVSNQRPLNKVKYQQQILKQKSKTSLYLNVNWNVRFLGQSVVGHLSSQPIEPVECGGTGLGHMRAVTRRGGGTGGLDGAGTETPGRQSAGAPAGLAERTRAVPGRAGSRLPASPTHSLRAGFVCV